MGMDTNKLISLRPLYMGIIKLWRPRGQHNSVQRSYDSYNPILTFVSIKTLASNTIKTRFTIALTNVFKWCLQDDALKLRSQPIGLQHQFENKPHSSHMYRHKIDVACNQMHPQDIHWHFHIRPSLQLVEILRHRYIENYLFHGFVTGPMTGPWTGLTITGSRV